MTQVGLRVGPLPAAGGFDVQRSGFRWIVPDGHVCRAGEPIAYCSLGLTAAPGSRPASLPFESERSDLQLLVAPRIGGRLRQSPRASLGGFIDLLSTYHWEQDFEIGSVEATPAEAASVPDAGLLRLVGLAGRRISEIVDIRSGLLSGWHDRSRAWWGEGREPTTTVLAMAMCEQYGILRGAAGGFFEIAAAVPGPAQVITVVQEPLLPTARIVLEQMQRTDDARQAIAADLMAGLAAGSSVPTPEDWIFAAALLNTLRRSPVTEITTILDRSGLRQAPPPAVLLLSVNAEIRQLGRHQGLGYAIGFHGFRHGQAGPAVRGWMRDRFAPLDRRIDDIRADYIALTDHLAATTGARLMVLNHNSTPAHEEIASYAGFPQPLSSTLGGVRAKELNLLLHDLAKADVLDIVDTDALVGQFGLRDHLPDSTHHSGALQAAIRHEILRILRERQIPGFAGVSVRRS